MTIPSRVSSRRHVVRPSPVARRSIGTEPWPGTWAGSGLPGSTRASTGTTTWISTGTSAARVCPVRRSTRVSAMICPRPRTTGPGCTATWLTAAAGVAADDDPVAGEQPPPRLPPFSGGEQVDRDRSVAGDLRGQRAAGVEQGLDRHHDLDLHRHVGGDGLSGEAFHEGVGHDLPASPDDRLRLHRHLVDRGGEGGVAGHGLLDRQMGGEVGHPVRGGAHRHPPPGAGRPAAGRELLRRDLRGQRPGQVVDPPHPEGLDPQLRQAHVDLGPLDRGQVRGGGDDGGGLVLAEPPGGEQLVHPGVPGGQIPGDPDPPAPFGEGDPAGQSDLGCDAALQGLGFDRSAGGPGFRVCLCERQNGVGLFGGDRGFPFFESRDPLDERRLGRRADAGR